MSDDFCHIHEYEPLPERYYRKCGECFHIYATAEDLVREDLLARANVSLPAAPMRPEDILTCPLCTHDF